MEAKQTEEKPGAREMEGNGAKAEKANGAAKRAEAVKVPGQPLAKKEAERAGEGKRKAEKEEKGTEEEKQTVAKGGTKAENLVG